MKNFSIIAAVDQQNGLGKNNTLIWHLPADLKHFSEITTNVRIEGKINAVIMGRKTWESLPQKYRPLPHRLNLVLTHNENFNLSPNVLHAFSLDKALEKLDAIKNIENIFVIGGGKVYVEALHHPQCEKIYLTRIFATFDCDTFFPAFDENIFQLSETSKSIEENGLTFRFLRYEKVLNLRSLPANSD